MFQSQARGTDARDLMHSRGSAGKGRTITRDPEGGAGAALQAKGAREERTALGRRVSVGPPTQLRGHLAVGQE